MNMGFKGFHRVSLSWGWFEAKTGACSGFRRVVKRPVAMRFRVYGSRVFGRRAPEEMTQMTSQMGRREQGILSRTAQPHHQHQHEQTRHRHRRRNKDNANDNTFCNGPEITLDMTTITIIAIVITCAAGWCDDASRRRKPAAEASQVDPTLF